MKKEAKQAIKVDIPKIQEPTLNINTHHCLEVSVKDNDLKVNKDAEVREILPITPPKDFISNENQNKEHKSEHTPISQERPATVGSGRRTLKEFILERGVRSAQDDRLRKSKLKDIEKGFRRYTVSLKGDGNEDLKKTESDQLIKSSTRNAKSGDESSTDISQITKLIANLKEDLLKHTSRSEDLIRRMSSEITKEQKSKECDEIAPCITPSLPSNCPPKKTPVSNSSNELTKGRKPPFLKNRTPISFRDNSRANQRSASVGRLQNTNQKVSDLDSTVASKREQNKPTRRTSCASARARLSMFTDVKISTASTIQRDAGTEKVLRQTSPKRKPSEVSESKCVVSQKETDQQKLHRFGSPKPKPLGVTEIQSASVPNVHDMESHKSRKFLPVTSHKRKPSGCVDNKSIAVSPTVRNHRELDKKNPRTNARRKLSKSAVKTQSFLSINLRDLEHVKVKRQTFLVSTKGKLSKLETIEKTPTSKGQEHAPVAKPSVTEKSQKDREHLRSASKRLTTKSPTRINDKDKNMLISEKEIDVSEQASKTTAKSRRHFSTHRKSFVKDIIRSIELNISKRDGDTNIQKRKRSKTGRRLPIIGVIKPNLMKEVSDDAECISKDDNAAKENERKKSANIRKQRGNSSSRIKTEKGEKEKMDEKVKKELEHNIKDIKIVVNDSVHQNKCLPIMNPAFSLSNPEEKVNLNKKECMLENIQKCPITDKVTNITNKHKSKEIVSQSETIKSSKEDTVDNDKKPSTVGRRSSSISNVLKASTVKINKHKIAFEKKQENIKVNRKLSATRKQSNASKTIVKESKSNMYEKDLATERGVKTVKKSHGSRKTLSISSSKQNIVKECSQDKNILEQSEHESCSKNLDVSTERSITNDPTTNVVQEILQLNETKQRENENLDDRDCLVLDEILKPPSQYDSIACETKTSTDQFYVNENDNLRVTGSKSNSHSNITTNSSPSKSKVVKDIIQSKELKSAVSQLMKVAVKFYGDEKCKIESQEKIPESYRQNYVSEGVLLTPVKKEAEKNNAPDKNDADRHQLHVLHINVGKRKRTRSHGKTQEQLAAIALAKHRLKKPSKNEFSDAQEKSLPTLEESLAKIDKSYLGSNDIESTWEPVFEKKDPHGENIKVHGNENDKHKIKEQKDFKQELYALMQKRPNRSQDKKERKRERSQKTDKKDRKREKSRAKDKKSEGSRSEKVDRTQERSSFHEKKDQKVHELFNTEANDSQNQNIFMIEASDKRPYNNNTLEFEMPTQKRHKQQNSTQQQYNSDINSKNLSHKKSKHSNHYDGHSSNKIIHEKSNESLRKPHEHELIYPIRAKHNLVSKERLETLREVLRQSYRSGAIATDVSDDSQGGSFIWNSRNNNTPRYLFCPPSMVSEVPSPRTSSKQISSPTLRKRSKSTRKISSANGVLRQKGRTDSRSTSLLRSRSASCGHRRRSTESRGHRTDTPTSPTGIGPRTSALSDCSFLRWKSVEWTMRHLHKQPLVTLPPPRVWSAKVTQNTPPSVPNPFDPPPPCPPCTPNSEDSYRVDRKLNKKRVAKRRRKETEVGAGETSEQHSTPSTVSFSDSTNVTPSDSAVQMADDDDDEYLEAVLPTKKTTGGKAMEDIIGSDVREIIERTLTEVLSRKLPHIANAFHSDTVLSNRADEKSSRPKSDRPKNKTSPKRPREILDATIVSHTPTTYKRDSRSADPRTRVGYPLSLQHSLMHRRTAINEQHTGPFSNLTYSDSPEKQALVAFYKKKLAELQELESVKKCKFSNTTKQWLESKAAELQTSGVKKPVSQNLVLGSAIRNAVVFEEHPCASRLHQGSRPRTSLATLSALATRKTRSMISGDEDRHTRANTRLRFRGEGTGLSKDDAPSDFTSTTGHSRDSVPYPDVASTDKLPAAINHKFPSCTFRSAESSASEKVAYFSYPSDTSADIPNNHTDDYIFTCGSHSNDSTSPSPDYSYDSYCDSDRSPADENASKRRTRSGKYSKGRLMLYNGKYSNTGNQAHDMIIDEVEESVPNPNEQMPGSSVSQSMASRRDSRETVKVGKFNISPVAHRFVDYHIIQYIPKTFKTPQYQSFQ